MGKTAGLWPPVLSLLLSGWGVSSHMAALKTADAVPKFVLHAEVWLGLVTCLRVLQSAKSWDSFAFY